MTHEEDPYPEEVHVADGILEGEWKRFCMSGLNCQVAYESLHYEMNKVWLGDGWLWYYALEEK